MGAGWCTPSGAEDLLCYPPVPLSSATTCSGISDDCRLPPCNSFRDDECNDDCVRQKCEDDSRCMGYFHSLTLNTRQLVETPPTGISGMGFNYR